MLMTGLSLTFCVWILMLQLVKGARKLEIGLRFCNRLIGARVWLHLDHQVFEAYAIWNISFIIIIIKMLKMSKMQKMTKVTKKPKIPKDAQE